MLNKIFLAVLVLSILSIAFFTFYGWSWLQSIGQPAAAVEGYEYHSQLGWMVLMISSALLLLIGNAVLWKTSSGWALWATFVFFGFFTLTGYFWLDPAALEFKKSNRLVSSDLSIGPLLGALLVAGAGILVFANQFVAVRLYRKIYPPIAAPEPSPDEEPVKIE